MQLQFQTIAVNREIGFNFVESPKVHLSVIIMTETLRLPVAVRP